MKVKDQLLQLKPYQPGKSVDAVKKEYGLEAITKLASNENPFGTSEKAKLAIFKCVDSLGSYPDGYSTNVREKVAQHLGVDESQIIFGNGSDEVIQIICRSYLAVGKNTVTAWPTFPQYRHNAIIEGAEVREVPLLNGKHDLEGMLSTVDNDTSVVWVCNPNNPSGTYVDNQELISFLDRIPSHVLVVVDEAYFEYATAADYPQTVKLLEHYPNLIILRTFSKAYGLAALRIGYGVASIQLVSEIEPAREPFNNNKLAQVAAAAAMEDQQFIHDCKVQNKQGLEQYYAFCAKHNLSYFPSEGNFILIDFNRQGDEVFQYLLERGYIVRSGNALGFPTAVRITIGTREQNEGIIGALTKMLEEKNVVC